MWYKNQSRDYIPILNSVNIFQITYTISCLKSRGCDTHRQFDSECFQLINL